jgi:hypothetical protein
LICQETYYLKYPKNSTCSCCRQETKDKYQPLNEELSEKKKLLKFNCGGCKITLTASDHGAGQGEHEESCKMIVKYKCACGEISFCANYA